MRRLKCALCFLFLFSKKRQKVLRMRLSKSEIVKSSTIPSRIDKRKETSLVMEGQVSQFYQNCLWCYNKYWLNHPIAFQYMLDAKKNSPKYVFLGVAPCGCYIRRGKGWSSWFQNTVSLKTHVAQKSLVGRAIVFIFHRVKLFQRILY